MWSCEKNFAMGRKNMFLALRMQKNLRIRIKTCKSAQKTGRSEKKRSNPLIRVLLRKTSRNVEKRAHAQKNSKRKRGAVRKTFKGHKERVFSQNNVRKRRKTCACASDTCKCAQKTWSSEKYVQIRLYNVF